MNSKTTSKAYTFNPPTINNAYCKIGAYSVVNVINSNITHPTNGILKSATCTSPDCLDLDLYTIDYNQTI